MCTWMCICTDFYSIVHKEGELEQLSEDFHFKKKRYSNLFSNKEPLFSKISSFLNKAGTNYIIIIFKCNLKTEFV